jgi:hypothetical protein
MQCFDLLIMASKKLLKVIYGAVTASNPDDFRWEPSQHTQVTEISILTYDNKLLALSILSDLQISDLIEPDGENVLLEETDLPTSQPNWVANYDRKAASLRGCNQQLLLTIGGVSQTSANIFSGEVRKFLQNFILRHPRCKVFQDVVNSNSHSTNAGFATALPSFNCYYVVVVHSAIVKLVQLSSKAETPRRN